MGFDIYVLVALVAVLVVLATLALVRRRRRLRELDQQQASAEHAVEPGEQAEPPRAANSARPTARDGAARPRPSVSPSAAPPAGEVRALEDERKYGRTFVDAWLGGDEDDSAAASDEGAGGPERDPVDPE